MKLFIFLISLAVFARGSALLDRLEELLEERLFDEVTLSVPNDPSGCFDVQPPEIWENNSCDEQKASGQCTKRKEQNSPYCRKTCGTCTVTEDVDCEGSWSACTAACETAAQRTFTVTVAPSGDGKACPTSTVDCSPGVGACEAAPPAQCSSYFSHNKCYDLLQGTGYMKDGQCSGSQCSDSDKDNCCATAATTCLRNKSCCLWGTTCYGCPDKKDEFAWAWTCASSRRCSSHGNGQCRFEPGKCCWYGSDCAGCPWGDEHVWPNVCGTSRRCKLSP